MQPPSPHPATRLSVSAQIFAFNLIFNYFLVILILGVHAIFLIFLSTSTIHQALGSIFQIVRWVHSPPPPPPPRGLSKLQMYYPKYHLLVYIAREVVLGFIQNITSSIASCMLLASFIDVDILNIGQYFIIFSNFKVYWILRYYSHRKMIYSIIIYIFSRFIASFFIYLPLRKSSLF